MLNHILATAKAYAALIGSILTVIIANTDAPNWVSVVAAICTAVATWAVPNTKAKAKK